MLRLVVFLILALITLSYGFNIQPRIVKGFVSEPGDYPFYVLIFLNGRVCGGSLISDRWILTAAHCTSTQFKAIAYIGFSNAESYDKVMKIESQNQYPHPSFTDDKYDNDIALMRLPEKIELSPKTQIAQLPTECQSIHNGGESVIFAGSGDYTIEDSPYNVLPRLRHGSSKIVSSDQCNNILTMKINQSLAICANVIDGQTSYAGDSGGPLIRESDGTLIGVLAFVNEHNEIEDPNSRVDLQISTNIQKYFDWISNVTGLNLPKC